MFKRLKAFVRQWRSRGSIFFPQPFSLFPHITKRREEIMKGFDQGFQRDKSAIQADFKQTMEDMRRAFNGK